MLKKRGRPNQFEKKEASTGYRGRPRKKDKSIQFCISMPFTLEQAIEKIARRKHKSFSSTFVELLSEALRKLETHAPEFVEFIKEKRRREND